MSRGGRSDNEYDPRLDHDDTYAHTPLKGDTLVIGDWVVDEHWRTGIHRSETASRTGDHHLRSLHGVYSSVISLGGAGHLAALLHETRIDEDSPFNVIGVGLWNLFDTETLRRLFHTNWLAQVTPYRLSAFHENGRRDVDVPQLDKLPQLMNIAKALKESDAVKKLRQQYELDGRARKRTIAEAEREESKDIPELQFFDWHGTNRVIRLFQETRGTLRQISRLDWHLAVPHMGDPNSRTEWITEEKTVNEFSKLLVRTVGSNNKEDGPPEKIKRVVIGDLVKGVISRPVIEELVKLYPRADWYVSTKNHAPDWLPLLNPLKGRVKHVLFHEAAARAAIRNHQVDQWFTPKTNRLTQSAMRFLDNVHKETAAALVVVTTEGWAVAARLEQKATGTDRPSNSDKAWACVQADEGSDHGSRDGPFSLPLSAALMAADAYVAAAPEDWDKDLLHAAHRLACARVVSEMDRFRHPNKDVDLSFVFSKRPAEAIQPGATTDATQPSPAGTSPKKPDEKTPDTAASEPVHSGNWKEEVWKDEEDKWKQAQEELCCVDTGEDRCIELWRSYTTLDKYVCLVPPRKTHIQRVLRRMRDFGRRQQEDRKSLSFMFISKPGNGKTYLVERLADAVGMTLLEFDISQMTRSEDILDCFDTVVTRQATSEKDIIAFVDEINTKINAQHVYSAFLGPLESGKYVRGGRTFSIKPCVWVFAGTDLPTGNGDGAHQDKGSDFESRLTLRPIRLDGDRHPLQKAENVYLGAALIKATFPDVRQVSERVLKLFYELDADVSLREIRHLV
ncbi:MAG: AAA family ATPase, partial [Phycisphaerae bacterium]